MVARLLAALLLALPLAAADSLVLTPGDSLTYTAPSSAPWTSLGSRGLTCAVDVTDWATGSTASDLWNFGDDLQITGADDGTSYLCAANNGTANTSQNACINVASRTVILFRAQVDYEDDLVASAVGNAGRIFFEVWDADGSNYEAAEGGANNSDGPAEYENVAGTNGVGGAATTAKILWCKQTETMVEPGPSAPLPKSTDVGELGDWDFDGDVLTDSSAYAMALSGSGHTFETTPTLDPAPDMTTGEGNGVDAPTVRAGNEVTLTGSCSSFADDPTCTCVWSDQSGGTGPDSILFTGSTTACTTTAVFPTFGSFTVRLESTDEDGTGTRDFEIGAVAQDSTEHVVYPTERINLLVGPQLAFGNSNWPWYDNRRWKLGNFFGPLIPDPATLTTATLTNTTAWGKLGAGTISVTNGSNVITGTGTDFQTDFCNGGTTAYTPPGTTGWNLYVIDDNGDYWRMPASGTYCNSATQITSSSTWNLPSDSGLSYLKDVNFGDYYGSSEFQNFYDNVLAYYAMWYATGHERWKAWGDTLAEYHWDYPQFQGGRCGKGPSSGSQCANLLVGGESLTGVMLWAEQEGTQATVYAGLEDILNRRYTTYCDMDNPTSDIRPSGYCAWIALAAELDPDATSTLTLQSEIDALVPPSPTRVQVWDAEIDYSLANIFKQANQDAMDGAWAHSRGTPSTLGAGNVSVTNGSPTVTCVTTCNFSAGTHGGKWLLFGTGGDSAEAWAGTRRTEYLVASVDSATQITLVENYAEATSGSIGWRYATSAHIWMQPFMFSFPGAYFDFIYKTRGTDTLQRLVDALDFNRTRGYRPHTGGFLTFVDNAGCQLAVDTQTNSSDCQYTNDAGTTSFSSSRYLLQEPMRISATTAIYSEQLGDPNAAAHRTFVDTMMGHAFGKWGGPQADYGLSCTSCYAQELNEGQTTFSSIKNKNWGFGFGWGGSYVWDALRDGLPEVESLTDYSVDLDIGGVSGATKATVTLYEPKGGVMHVVNDQTGSTATVTGDSRQGTHVAKIEYKNAMETVLETAFVLASEGAPEEPAAGGNLTLTGSMSMTGGFGLAYQLPPNPEVLADPGGRVAVNPVTGQLAYDHRVGPTYFEVHISDADGSNEVCFSCDRVDLPDRHIGNPVWSPDGEWLVFQAQNALATTADEFATPGLGMFNNLYACEIDADDCYLVHSIAYQTPATALLHPQFNHAGTKLMWAETEDLSVNFNGDWFITIADWDAGTHTLSNLTDYTPGDEDFYETHGWNDDDTLILYTAATGSYLDLDIFTWDLSGTPSNLTNDLPNVWDEHAHFSHDGSRIVWMSSRGFGLSPFRTEFWVMDADGSNKEQISDFNDPEASEYPGYNAVAADHDWNLAGDSIVGYVQESGADPEDGELVEVFVP